MGQGYVKSNLGGGKYLVTVKRHLAHIQERLTDISAQLTSALTKLGELLGLHIPFAKLKVKNAEDAWLAAIQAYATAQINKTGNLVELKAEIYEAGEVFAKEQAELDKFESQKVVLEIKKKSLEFEKQYLLKAPPDQDEKLWCADLTEDISSGETVRLIETPDNNTNIAPQSLEDASPAFYKYIPELDGVLQSPVGNTGYPYATMFNWFLTAAMDKWRPRFRHGVITALDGDNCDVTLDECLSPWYTTSSAGGEFSDVNVNVGDTLLGVPIKYLDCDSAAFVVGDHVIVEFPFRTWEERRVIGFVDNPKPCGGWVESFGPAIYDMSWNDKDLWPPAWKAPGGDWSPITDLVSLVRDMGDVSTLLDRDNWAEPVLTPGIARRGVGAYLSKDHHKILTLKPFNFQGFQSDGAYLEDTGGVVLDYPGGPWYPYSGVINRGTGCIIFPGDNEDILVNGEASTDFRIWDDWTRMEVTFEMSHATDEGVDLDSDYAWPALLIVLYHSVSNYNPFGIGGSGNQSYLIATVVCVTNAIYGPPTPILDGSNGFYFDSGIRYDTINGRSVWSNRHLKAEALADGEPGSPTVSSANYGAWIFDNQSAPHTNNPFTRTGFMPPFSGTFSVTRDEIRCTTPIRAVGLMNALPDFGIVPRGGNLRVHSIRFYRN